MKYSHRACILVTIAVSLQTCTPFPCFHLKSVNSKHSSNLFAGAPSRLDDNVDGVLYVNDKCISCSACNMFSPSIFSYSPKHSKYVVTQQPTLTNNLEESRAAMSACPVSAIRVENSAKFNHENRSKLSPQDEQLAKGLALAPKFNGLKLPFPRPLVGGTESSVWYLGHANSKSFGAVSYLVKGTRSGITVMVDTPRFCASAVRAVESLTGKGGPDYMFLTHVDDTADHGAWRSHFEGVERIFHDGDLGEHNWIGDHTLEDVEVLLRGGLDDDNHDGFKAWTLDGQKVPDFSLDSKWSDRDEHHSSEFVILHTPGHSPGSVSLLFRADMTPHTGILFTGDTLGYSNKLHSMTGFPDYGNDLKLQSKTLKKLALLPQWDFVAPGHGQSWDYGITEEKRKEEIIQAADDLLAS